MTTRVSAAAGIVALIAAVAFAWRDRGAEPPEDLRRALPVEVVTLQSVNQHQQTYEYTGTIVSGMTSELGFERAGKLTELLVDEGASVQDGATLARLDTRQLLARKGQLESQLAGAEAKLLQLQNGPRAETIAAARARVRSLESQLAMQKRSFGRRSALARSNAVSAEELDETRFGSQSSQAQLDEAKERLNELLAGTRTEELTAQQAVVGQLEASLRSITVDLEDSVLKAPFSGTITRRFADDGTVVNIGQSVFRLVGNTTREAHVGVPADVALSLELGGTMRVTASGGSWNAKLRTVLPELNVSTRTQTAVLEIDPTPDGAMPVAGDIARISVPRQVSASGFWVPVVALEQGQRGLWAVLAVEPSGETLVVRRRDVEVLFSTESEALIRGTLSEGDQIVASGMHRLVPGQRVEVEDRGDSAALAAG